MGHDLRLFALLAFYSDLFYAIDRESLLIHRDELSFVLDALSFCTDQDFHIVPEVLLVLHLRLKGISQTHGADLQRVVRIHGIEFLHEKTVQLCAEIHIHSRKAIHLH